MDRTLRLATLPRLAGLVVIAMLLDAARARELRSPVIRPAVRVPPAHPNADDDDDANAPPRRSASRELGRQRHRRQHVLLPTYRVCKHGYLTFSIAGQPSWASFSTTTVH